MGRIVYLIMGIVAINLGLFIFSCPSTDPITGACVPPSNIWTFIWGPNALDDSNIWATLFGTASGLAALAAVAVTVGSFFLRVEFPLYASMALALIAPVTSWIKFFNQVLESPAFGDGTAKPLLGTIIAVILISPIIVTYIFTLIDWARGRD